ncbi:hypothetical protein NC652_013633 [Populus alba x Populus x berolinensis]|nr:hypothetical protein NC652_013633 [Populus alba x Populus x berolinensis]
MATRAKHVHALGVRKTESVVVCVLQTLEARQVVGGVLHTLMTGRVCVLQTLEARQVMGSVLHTLMTGRVCDPLDLVRHLFIYLFTLAAWFIVVHGGTSSNIGKLRQVSFLSLLVGH